MKTGNRTSSVTSYFPILWKDLVKVTNAKQKRKYICLLQAQPKATVIKQNTFCPSNSICPTKRIGSTCLILLAEVLSSPHSTTFSQSVQLGPLGESSLPTTPMGKGLGSFTGRGYLPPPTKSRYFMSPMFTCSCWFSNGSHSKVIENCSSHFPNQQGPQKHHHCGTTEQGWIQPTGKADLSHPYSLSEFNSSPTREAVLHWNIQAWPVFLTRLLFM